MSILVFGSLNMDLVARTPRLPKPGETLTGQSFETVPGGKGANQAVAVARQGVAVELIGRVGRDAFGNSLLASLRRDRVQCDRVQQDADKTSGVALIAVDDRGENHIIIVPGANGALGSADVERLRERLPQASSLLLQLEVPLAAVQAAAKAAKQAGVRVMLDPAPVPDQLPAELYPLIDILTPNQTEASRLVGFEVKDLASAADAAIALRQRGVGTVIIKLGGQGAFFATPEESFYIAPFPVTVVDTVAAGDAFNGGLAVALSEGRSLRDSGRWASATGALAVMQAGAQSAMPVRSAVAALIERSPK